MKSSLTCLRKALPILLSGSQRELWGSELDMAVNKTAEPWPDERLSDLDHDSCIIKIIKNRLLQLECSCFRAWRNKTVSYSKILVFPFYNELLEQMTTIRKYSIRPLTSAVDCNYFSFHLKSPVDEILSISSPQNQCYQPPVLISKARERARASERMGSRRGARADQWANKTNQWYATTEKSEVINLQRQDDPTNHMHWLEMRSAENLQGVSY